MAPPLSCFEFQKYDKIYNNNSALSIDQDKIFPMTLCVSRACLSERNIPFTVSWL